ncbi:MAG: ankyrin repeat domain-containing protein [Parvularculales bacterium]
MRGENNRTKAARPYRRRLSGTLIISGVLFLLAVFPAALQAQEGEDNELLKVRFWKTARVFDLQTALKYGNDINGRDELGFTPLHHAVRNERADLVEVLLENGVDTESRAAYTGWTPLYFAADSPEIVELLLDYGADALAKDRVGRTPYHYLKDSWNFRKTTAYRRLKLKQPVLRPQPAARDL